jgi:hypothetical protein
MESLPRPQAGSVSVRLGAKFVPLLVVVGLLLLPNKIEAAAITVSPAFQDILLPAMATSKDVSVTFSNQSSSPQTYRLSAVDFGSLDESGGVAFLGVPSSELEHRYGLVSWITLEKDQIFLPPAGSAKVIVHIDNRASLAPGGHYAAILATSTGDPDASQDKTKVNLRQIIASLLLVRKEGGAEIGLNAAGITLGGHGLFTVPKYVYLRYQNPGNVHVVPRGTVSVKDPSGNIVLSGVINEDSDIIMPESFRKIRVSLTSLKSAWAPGRYTLTANYRYDGTADIRTSKITFWYMGRVLNLLILALLASTIGAIISLYMRRRKKR